MTTSPSDSEAPSPYGAGLAAPSAGSAARPKKVRVPHLQAMKDRGERIAMLTSYDQLTAEIFDQAGIPVLLVGDSAANNVLGYETTLPVTVDELIPLVRAVSRAARRALVVADLPFGSYQTSPEQALTTSVRFMKEAGAHAVKLEGGASVVEQVRTLVGAGIPVMAHLGFTPQSEHSLGGYRVQGRGDHAEQLVQDALAVEAAGAFAVVLEMVPADVAKRVTAELAVPTIGIGAGVDCDGQVLVWQDMAGMRSGPMPRFVKQYADLRSVLTDAATAFRDEVSTGAFPAEQHSFE
jgi:3-methyl-2-oxobutanoate hydroxymethyltransferase